MIGTCISLYFMEGVLPEHCQLLFCSSESSHDDIDAFLHCAFFAHTCISMVDRLFCALSINELSDELYFYFQDRLRILYQTVHPLCIRLAIFCNSSGEFYKSSKIAIFVKEIEPQKVISKVIWEVLSHDKFLQITSSTHAGLGKSKRIEELSKS